MIMQDKKQYPLWDHYRYTFHYLKVKEGSRALAVCAGDTLLGILLPFLEAALAGAVAACLVSGRSAEQILALAAGYMILLQSVRFLQSHVKALWQKTLMLYRLNMVPELDRKWLEMDGQSLESASGQAKYTAALRNLYSGNDAGIGAFTGAFWDMLCQLGGLAVYGTIVGQYSRFLLILLFFQALAMAWIHTRAGKRAYQAAAEIDDQFKGLRYLWRESIAPGNGKDIRLYRMDTWFLEELHVRIGRVAALIDRRETRFAAADITGAVLVFLRSVIVYGWLIREMASGNLTLPAFLFYVGMVAGVETWMNGLFDAVQRIYRNKELMDSYRDFMEFGIPEEERKEPPAHSGSVHEIRLENVCFRYEGNETDTIHNLNLTIAAGERLALVGENGAGKTTLIKLLCGLYRPTRGKIYLDGQDMQSFSRKDIFREFSVVFQDVFSFAFSLAENVSCVAMGQEDEARMQDSLRKAGLWEKVISLPKGTATAMNKDLDENGVTLSGGELQRLMLARALYKDAPVVILDEPTAALDPIAESEMYEKYDSMIRNRTGIFISHRLSSTRFCNRILFMEKGRIIEEGDHDQLMRQGGAYAGMFAIQARYYQKKEESYE